MNSSRYTCVFMIVCFLEFTEVTTFSDYDYISQMRRGIWFTPYERLQWLLIFGCRRYHAIFRTQKRDLRDQA